MIWSSFTTTSQDTYPERLNKTIVYPSGVIFWSIWNVVKWFLDPVTRNKVSPCVYFYGVQEHIADEHIPVCMVSCVFVRVLICVFLWARTTCHKCSLSTHKCHLISYLFLTGRQVHLRVQCFRICGSLPGGAGPENPRWEGSEGRSLWQGEYEDCLVCWDFGCMQAI